VQKTSAARFSISGQKTEKSKEEEELADDVGTSTFSRTLRYYNKLESVVD
jgi:hypothetical protein